MDVRVLNEQSLVDTKCAHFQSSSNNSYAKKTTIKQVTRQTIKISESTKDRSGRIGRVDEWDLNRRSMTGETAGQIPPLISTLMQKTKEGTDVHCRLESERIRRVTESLMYSRGDCMWDNGRATTPESEANEEAEADHMQNTSKHMISETTPKWIRR